MSAKFSVYVEDIGTGICPHAVALNSVRDNISVVNNM
jgi:hypothetical protein